MKMIEKDSTLLIELHDYEASITARCKVLREFDIDALTALFLRNIDQSSVFFESNFHERFLQYLTHFNYIEVISDSDALRVIITPNSNSDRKFQPKIEVRDFKVAGRPYDIHPIDQPHTFSYPDSQKLLDDNDGSYCEQIGLRFTHDSILAKLNKKGKSI
jgi:hypothetical protein